MIEKILVCVSCGYRFVAKLMGKEEAQERGFDIIPLHCPVCGSKAVVSNV